MASNRTDRYLQVRARSSTLDSWRPVLAYGRYLHGYTADQVLAELFRLAAKRYRHQCKRRGIPVDFPLSGLKRAAKPMPDLRKPGPKVD